MEPFLVYFAKPSHKSHVCCCSRNLSSLWCLNVCRHCLSTCWGSIYCITITTKPFFNKVSKLAHFFFLLMLFTKTSNSITIILHYVTNFNSIRKIFHFYLLLSSKFGGKWRFDFLESIVISTLSTHIKNIYDEGELDRNSTIRNFLTVQNEGNRSVKRNIDYYKKEISTKYRQL